MNRKLLLRSALLLPLACAFIVGCAQRSGHLLDEARVAQRGPDSFVAADEDFFHDMDGGIALTPAEVRGRTKCPIAFRLSRSLFSPCPPVPSAVKFRN